MIATARLHVIATRLTMTATAVRISSHPNITVTITTNALSIRIPKASTTGITVVEDVSVTRIVHSISNLLCI